MCFWWPNFMPGASAVEASSTANSDGGAGFRSGSFAHWLSGTALIDAARPLCSMWQVRKAEVGRGRRLARVAAAEEDVGAGGEAAPGAGS
jgi:hypothetical protein